MVRLTRIGRPEGPGAVSDRIGARIIQRRSLT